MDGTTFSVSASPITALSGGAVVTGYACGNATYELTNNRNNINAPMRVGIFAGTSSNTGRVSAGATYYGIMEMSGNLWEHEISIGRSQGRAFTGTQGNGILNPAGNVDVYTWPDPEYYYGTGHRGGSFQYIGTRAQVSDRYYAADGAAEQRNGAYGGRGVRTIP
jgi:formylglycine-generating enzyme required for sulfatase activity